MLMYDIDVGFGLDLDVLYSQEKKRKGNKMALSNLISDEIKRIYPDIKPYLADRYANKYVSVVLSEIKQAILRPHNPNEELGFNSKEVYNACGVIEIKTRERLFTFLQRTPHTRLIDITFRGNIGKLSRVKLNPIYKDQIMLELLDMPVSAMTALDRKKIKERANVVVEIDPHTLSGFMQHTQQQLGITGPGKYYDRLHANLMAARELYVEHQTQDGHHYLMEYWETADTGRQYGHFNSLQRMTKEVRNAALGFCHKYDFQAHSFAVMGSLAKTIDPTIKIAQIEDYIRYRTPIRQRIAKEVGVSEEAIKSVFTSLGFGAKPVNNPYTAIRRAVYTEEKFNLLINQIEFKFIMEDLQRINDIIDATLPREDFVWNLNRTYHQHNPEGRKRTRNQRLAWIYQNTEAYITSRFIDIVRERSGQEPLLSVHDCVYYKQKLPSSVVIDAQVILREEYQFIKIEHEPIYPIGTEAQYHDHFADNEQQHTEHQQRIHQEELVARGYRSCLVQTDPVWSPGSLDRILAVRTQSELPDYVEYEYELEDYR